jgi:hypothetical protein
MIKDFVDLELSSGLFFNPRFTVDVFIIVCRNDEPKLSAHVAYDRNGLLGVYYVEIVCDMQPVFVGGSVETSFLALVPDPIVTCDRLILGAFDYR